MEDTTESFRLLSGHSFKLTTKMLLKQTNKQKNNLGLSNLSNKMPNKQVHSESLSYIIYFHTVQVPTLLIMLWQS